MNAYKKQCSQVIKWFMFCIVGVSSFIACDNNEVKNKMLSDAEEHWYLAGYYKVARPSDYNIGLLNVLDIGASPKPKIKDPHHNPDGRIHSLPIPAIYVSDDNTFYLTSIEHYGSFSNRYHDMWSYNTSTEERRWISQKHWVNICGCALSPDQNSLAIIATERGDNQAHIFNYDRLKHTIVKIVDNVLPGSSYYADYRPVYNEACNRLYYVTNDHAIAYYDLHAKTMHKLPLGDASVVITVKGDEILYAKDRTRNVKNTGARSICCRLI